MTSDNIAYKLRGCGYKNCAPCYMKGYEMNEITIACAYLDRLYEKQQMTGVCVDVGAHVGLWSLALSEWYQNRYNVKPLIYALEPDASNFVRLRQNAQQDETGIVPAQVAAWNRSDWLYLEQNENPGRHKVHQLAGQQQGRMRVQAVALDDVANTPDKRKIDLIKIDVEGAELHVLNGARSILVENEHLLVIVEYCVEHLEEYGDTPQQITKFMQAHGFKPVRPQDIDTIKTIRAGELKRVMFAKGDLT